jgi:hypothetical protein
MISVYRTRPERRRTKTPCPPSLVRMRRTRKPIGKSAAEELPRCGVALVFLQAPSGETAEDRLLVQFQGMIAEYERAQILERYRRGKRHKAQIGVVNVPSGAPYGYRYVKKSDTAEACYQVIEHEADVVRMVFDAYTRGGLHQRHRAASESPADCHAPRRHALGALDRAGHAAQSRLSGLSLLRKDRSTATAADYARAEAA